MCLEAEEIVVETNTFSFEDNILCRKLNWLIQMSWTLRRHNLILRLLLEHQVNPVDFLIYVINQIDRAPREFRELFKQFDKDARDELFPTYEDVVEHYSTDEKIKGLKSGGFKKLNTFYAGKALVINNQVIQFYRQMANELISRKDSVSERFEEMMEECILFSEERSLSAKTITEIEHKNASVNKILSLKYDIPAWETDPERRPLNEFRAERPLQYLFFTQSDQNEAIRSYLNVLPRKDKDYQLQKMCEPFYGIRKEHLNYSYRTA